jgi:DNA-binding Lrp family transcriptional regulator
MKLSSNEIEIVACLAFDASKSMAEVAATLGLKEHVVRHAVKRMIDSDTMRLRPYVNPYALGLMEFYAEISLETPGREAMVTLIDALVGMPTSTFVGEVSGDVNLSVMFLARSIEGIATFFDEVCRRAPNLRFTKTVSPLIQLTVSYPRPGSTTAGNNSLSYGAGAHKVKFDEVDAKILLMLGSGGISSKRDLSKRCDIPQTTLDYRLKTLQERGILIAMGYMVPWYRDGLHRYSLRVMASRPCEELNTLVTELSSKHPAVRAVLRLTGRCDYEIDVRLTEPAMISPFTQELHRHLGAYVSRIEVLTPLALHKMYVSEKHLGEMLKLLTEEPSRPVPSVQNAG